MKDIYENPIPLSSKELQKCVLSYISNKKDSNSLFSILGNYIFIGKSYLKKKSMSQDEDFISELVIKVIECLNKYNTEGGATFKTYFYKRLNGFMYDYIRVKSNNNNISLYAINTLNQIKKKIESGKATQDDLEKYDKFLIKMGDIRDTLDLDNIHISNTKNIDIESKLITEEALKIIKNKINDKDYYILENYITKKINFTEIGKNLNISKQAVRSRYIKTLKRVNKYFNQPTNPSRSPKLK